MTSLLHVAVSEALKAGRACTNGSDTPGCCNWVQETDTRDSASFENRALFVHCFKTVSMSCSKSSLCKLCAASGEGLVKHCVSLVID